MKKFFKYFSIFVVVFLIFRLMDKDNPLIGDAIDDRTDLEMISDYKPEHRPEGIPENAVWRGGIDFGDYIVLPKALEEEGKYYAEIYSDTTGKVIYKGVFQYIYPEGATDKPIDPTRTDINMVWDGERLFLSRSTQHLLAIDPFGKD